MTLELRQLYTLEQQHTNHKFAISQIKAKP